MEILTPKNAKHAKRCIWEISKQEQTFMFILIKLEENVITQIVEEICVILLLILERI